MTIAWWEILARLVAAFILGGLIGWERETRGKPAGLRTIILVSVSSCLFTLSSMEAVARYGGSLDIVRAMAGVAQGVGFLGAGVIMQSRGEVRWLTTAASLWAAAAVGYSIALGLYVTSVIGAFIVFVTLRWLVGIEGRIERRGRDRSRQDQD